MSTSASEIVEVSTIKDPKQHSNYMTALGIMDILLNCHFKIVVTIPGSTVVTLAKHQRITVTKAPPVVLIHSNDDEPSTYSPAFIHDKSVNAVEYRLRSDQIERLREHATVQESDKVRLKSNWREEVNIGEGYEKHCQKRSALLKKFDYSWDGHLCRTATARNRIALTGDDVRAVCSAPHRERLTTRQVAAT